MNTSDQLPDLFDRDFAGEIFRYVLRLAREAEDLGMVSGVDQPGRGVVSAVVERHRLPVTAAPMGHEKARDAFGK